MKKLMKNLLKIIGIVLLILFIAYLSFILWNFYRMNNGDLVKWDNKWYTKEKLKEMYPPQEYNVEAKNTPEEVYTAFRQALLDDDVEGALELMVEGSSDRYKGIFNDNEQLKKFKELPLTDKLKQESLSGNFSTYVYFEDYMNKDDIPFTILFEKNSKGYWKIDSI